MFVLARSVWLALLGCLFARPAAALFGAAPVVQLYTNDVTPGADSIAGTFTPPTYTGYLDQAVTATGPYVSAAGLCFEAMGDLTWAVGTNGESATIRGFIVKNAGGDYQGGARFAAPVTVTGPTGAFILGQNIQIDPRIQLGAPDLEP